jgi:hypothetical protein
MDYPTEGKEVLFNTILSSRSPKNQANSSILGSPLLRVKSANKALEGEDKDSSNTGLCDGKQRLLTWLSSLSF